MRLRVLLPSRVLLDEPVAKVLAEGLEGHFCLLPRHVDLLAALVPGVLTWVPADAPGEERFVAVDHGLLVKEGPDVRVAVRRAVAGDSLADLLGTVDSEFRAVDEQERKARAAAARLESGFVRRFLDVSRHG
jgi:F-type H+-transporting ATPase subunit epsilon